MIVSSVCDKGGRQENLDCIIEFRGSNDFHAVLVVDAYGCKQHDIERFAVGMEGVSCDGISSANDLLGRINVDFNIKMSVVCIARSDGRVSLSSLGDCRAYSECGDLLTLDHTNAWHDLAALDIDTARIGELVKRHPGRRVLRKFLKFPEPVHFAEEISIGSWVESNYLLCTDGFWEHLDQSNLRNLMSGGCSIETFSEGLSGAPDNYTACLVRF
ncbi:MAG: PP2C family protein-serine/threonine phosphatase [Pseudomonadales bacterium]